MTFARRHRHRASVNLVQQVIDGMVDMVDMAPARIRGLIGQ
jgi:hypothetical protein